MTQTELRKVTNGTRSGRLSVWLGSRSLFPTAGQRLLNYTIMAATKIIALFVFFFELTLKH